MRGKAIRKAITKVQCRWMTALAELAPPFEGEFSDRSGYLDLINCGIAGKSIRKPGRRWSKPRLEDHAEFDRSPG